MAKGHPINPGYKAGDNWSTCRRCGFERRVSELSEEWNGLKVCTDTCYEIRHPQDFLRAQQEQIVADHTGFEDSTSTVADSDAATAIAASQAAAPAGCFTVPSGDNDNDL